jgi:hypothetical protein
MKFFLLFFLFNFSLYAQKANFKAAEKFSQKNLSEMIKTTRISPKWFHESDKFWYSYTTTNGKHFYVVDPIKKTKTKMLDNLDFCFLYWVHNIEMFAICCRVRIPKLITLMKPLW